MFTEKDIELAKEIEVSFKEFIDSGKINHLEGGILKLFICHTMYLAKLENEIKDLKSRLDAGGK